MSGQKGTKGGGARSNHQTGGRGSASSRKFEKEAYMEDAVVDVAEAANHAQFSSRSAPSFGRVPQEKRERLKATMTRLIVSDSKQVLVRETLEQITGRAFKFRDKSDYVDSGENLSRHYWMEDKQLQVYGVIKAKTDEELSPEMITRNFAVQKLKSYGFHTTYCEQALDITDGDLGRALEHLHNSCFGLPLSNSPNSPDSEQLSAEQRLEEKITLSAIYDDTVFREVITDRLWTFKVQAPYLTKYCGRPNGGHSGLTNSEPRPTFFHLEVRFPQGCTYPYEPPVICVSVGSDDGEPVQLPKFICLNVAGKLVEEARQSALYHTPSIFSLISMLENESSLTDCLQSRPSKYSLPMPSRAATQKASQDLQELGPLHRPRQTQSSDSLEDMVKLNGLLKVKFARKTGSTSYIKMQQYRQSLPAWQFCKQIVDMVASSRVTIVCGATGCGKSTQIGQFLLDDFLLSQEDHRYIICTQPRRISAVAVAQRVADERDEKVGLSVGYQIRLESVMSASTRLLFCTTGVLLRRLESDTTLNHVTHIIVDEVHERSEESDFLLLILRDMLTLRPDLHIILMSATLNSNLFSNYFGGVPVVDIPGRTFAVQQIFLEELLEKTHYLLEEGSAYCKQPSKTHRPELNREIFKGGCSQDLMGHDEWYLMKQGFATGSVTPAKDYVRDEDLKIHQVALRYADCSDRVQRTLAFMDHEKINYDLIENLIVWILSGKHEYPRQGSILVFLPGLAEISTMYEQLQRNSETSGRSGKCVVVPLHSSLTSEEQSLIFAKPKDGARKIVIATNLAETSITIDDCVFVIDSGRMKENRYDPNKQMDTLETVWVSVANALQRRGRAGRVRPGVCFHLYTSHRYNHHLAHQPPPEIHLVSLERIILRCKVLPVFAALSEETVLNRLIEPPCKENVDESIERLKYLGALDSNRNLTSFGCHLAALPVDLRVGKLIIFGAMFRCVDSALTMAACLSYKSPFVSPWKQREEAHKKKLHWSVAQSDYLTVLKVFKAWQENCARSKKAGYTFADENFLSVKTLQMLASLKQQYVQLLSSIGFLPTGLSRASLTKPGSDVDGVLQVTGAKMNENGGNYPLLLSVLCASLYPQLVRVLRPEHRFNQSAAGAVPAAPRAQQLRFRTKDDDTVFIHPSSVLHSCGHYESPYVVFHEKIKTSRVFIRECSMVPAFPLILCGGSEIHVRLDSGNFLLAIDDGWIKFICDSHEVAELLAALRYQLNALLADKIRNPSLDLYSDQRSDTLLATITKLITNPSAD